MIITRKSKISGILRTKNIPILADDYARWLAGDKIQDVAPYLSADDQEFIISGITSEEWDELFKEEEARMERQP